MSSVLVTRLIHQNCSKTILGSSLNVFCRRVPIQALASFSAIQKNTKNGFPPIHIQKSNLNMSVVRRSADVGHDHVKHWTAERVLTVALVAAIPAAIAVPSPAIEYFLALSLTVHSHWGVEAIVLDYVRPSVFGNVIPKLAVASVYGLTALTLGGLFYFIYSDVGLVNAVKLLWKL